MRPKRYAVPLIYVLGQTVLSLTLLLCSGCAYRLGRGSRSIPGGASEISIPIFKNRSQEVGAEVAFTQALQQEFLRSKVARVVDDPKAEARIEGEIVSIEYVPEAKMTGDESAKSGRYLPNGTVIASQYRIVIVVSLKVVRRSDGEKVWEGGLKSGDRTYAAPLVTLPGVNTVNPLYNLSARRQNLESIASEMMLEMHNQITENF